MDLLKQRLSEISGKIFYGFSFYGFPKKENTIKKKIGLELKKELRTEGISSRFVEGKDLALSSVIVAKNKLLSQGKDFLFLRSEREMYLGETLAAQEFENYGRRDFGRPARDTLSGTLPPKLAQIMINLSETQKRGILLDPFCGSGTILSEALVMGYKNIIGSDVSKKAIEDSKKNLEWITKNILHSKFNIPLHNLDARKLSAVVKQQTVDGIATEPYLGPPLRGNEPKEKIQKIIGELHELYLDAFGEFKKILKPKGRVVIIIPAFRYKKEVLSIPIIKDIEKIGFKKENNFLYAREGQKILRDIHVFVKK